MIHPVELLRRTVSALPDDTSSPLIWHGCMVLGRAQVRTDVPWDDHLPLGQLYHPYTLNDLCDEIYELIKQRHISAEFLVSGVFQSIIDRYERWGDPKLKDDSLNDSLDLLRRLEFALTQPIEKREVPTPDDLLRKMIQDLKDGMLRGPKFREDCLDVAARIRRAWDDAFTNSYWLSWEQSSTTSA